MTIPNNYTIELLQGEWSLIHFINDYKYHILASPGILHCTGLLGYDEEKKVGFMAHYDRMESTKSLPDIFEKISELLEDDKTLYVTIIGGWKFWWSPFTRYKIVNFLTRLNNNGWRIIIKETNYNKFCQPFGVELNMISGNYNFDYGNELKVRKESKNKLFKLKKVAKYYHPEEETRVRVIR